MRAISAIILLSAATFAMPAFAQVGYNPGSPHFAAAHRHHWRAGDHWAWRQPMYEGRDTGPHWTGYSWSYGAPSGGDSGMIPGFANGS